ncbi:hypothetical protein AZH51_01860 [Branchiibius sp. NY16-3462-2]|nr:hypothetical protein AZH51_01860 [Branchiibius sp. NY16-3462-2]
MEYRRGVRKNVLWHYTDAAASIGLLSSNTLWATSILHLNDSSELKFGLERADVEIANCSAGVDPVAAGFLKAIRDELWTEQFRQRFFVACASTEEDDLSQWRGYTGSTGYSIGLDIDTSQIWGIVVPNQSGLDPTQTPADSPRFEGLGRWAPVEYGPESQREQFRFILNSACGSAQEVEAPGTAPQRRRELLAIHAGYLALAATRCKSAGFHGEHEWRLVVADPKVDGCIQFRAGPFGITPYLAVTPPPADLDASVGQFYTGRANTLSVHDVCVGPTREPQTAKNGMDRLLAETGRRGLVAKLSDSTYRGS